MALRSHSAKSPGVHAPLASASMQDACNSVVVESKTRNHIRERQAPVDEAAGHAEASSCDSRAPETATCAHMPHFGGDSTAASRPPNEEDAAMDSPVVKHFHPCHQAGAGTPRAESRWCVPLRYHGHLAVVCRSMLSMCQVSMIQCSITSGIVRDGNVWLQPGAHECADGNVCVCR